MSYEVNLTAADKALLEQRHRETRDVREHDRIKAILLNSEGWSQSAIAQALRVHEGTIGRHLKEYLEEKKLKYTKGGSSSYLTAEQTQALIEHLSAHLYHYTYEIVEYVLTRWGIDYTVAGMNKWLHHHRFSYKKPKGKPYKADAAKQKAFIKAYKKLKKTLSPQEKLLFIDAVHPSQATKLSYGWIRTGQTLPIETSGSRTRMNLIGAIELDHLDEAFVRDYKTVNGESVGDFLTHLKAQHSSTTKLHIILDQAGYHRCDELQKKAEELDIVLHYLPPYSPNLNPIERLWKVMNEYARNNRFFSSPKEFRKAIKEFFCETLPTIGKELSNRINDNFQELIHAN